MGSAGEAAAFGLRLALTLAKPRRASSTSINLRRRRRWIAGRTGSTKEPARQGRGG
jgi:hypothetical protein